MTTSDLQQFYDDFADSYHLIFVDWQNSSQIQGRIIDKLIQTQLDSEGSPIRVLDCTCGIGTQAIGLALQSGYQIHGTDISPAEIERAQIEAKKAGVNIEFSVADMRTLAEQVEGEFDVVMSFDNAIPHLLTDEELHQALQSIHAKVKSHGIFMASIRDYDALLEERPKLNSQRIMDNADGKRVTLQYWEWADDIYTVNQFILKQNVSAWVMEHYATQYRALRRATLSSALTKAGFSAVEWLRPEESDYYQPIVIARK